MASKLFLSEDGRGFFRTIGYQRNERGERVPRKFRLGYDRLLARRKLEALLDAWDELPGTRGEKVWTDSAIARATAPAVADPEPIVGLAGDVPMMFAATPVVPPRPAPVPQPRDPLTDGLTLNHALDEFAAFTAARNDVGSFHRDGTRGRISSIKVHLGVTAVSDHDPRTLGGMPLRDVNAETLARIRNLITSRPLTLHQRKNRRPISIDTVKNWLMALGMAFDWFEITPRVGWNAPHPRWREQFALTKKQEYALQTADERDNVGRPKPAFRVDELVKVYKTSTKLGRKYLLMGLMLGWAQEAIKSFRRCHFVQVGGECFIDRRRGKTGVHGFWWVCPELAALLTESMGWTPANPDDLAFLTEDGHPLVHGKTDTIRLTWERCLNYAPADVRRLPFGRVKKAGAQVIENLASHETAQLFLAHRARTVAARNYVGADVNVGIGKSPYEKLHDAQREMWRQLKPLFDAVKLPKRSRSALPQPVRGAVVARDATTAQRPVGETIRAYESSTSPTRMHDSMRNHTVPSSSST